MSRKSKRKLNDDPNVGFNRVAMYFAFFLSALIVLMGIGMFISAGYLTWISARSNLWPKSNGTILSSEIATDTVVKNRVRYYPKVAYSFEVDGVSYRGSRIAFKELREKRPEMVQAILSSYPVGKKVDVYYRPSDPGRCVLETGFHISQVLLYLVFGLAFLFVGIIFCRLCWDNIVDSHKDLKCDLRDGGLQS